VRLRDLAESVDRRVDTEKEAQSWLGIIEDILMYVASWGKERSKTKQRNRTFFEAGILLVPTIKAPATPRI